MMPAPILDAIEDEAGVYDTDAHRRAWHWLLGLRAHLTPRGAEALTIVFAPLSGQQRVALRVLVTELLARRPALNNAATPEDPA